MNKLISWFEIPALDLKRARAFYEQILGVRLREEQMGPNRIAVFPYDREQATGGCVIAGKGYAPSPDGAVVYLNANNSANNSIDAVLALVEAAGGRIAMPKTALPPGMGAIAYILDSEGNRIGLHGAS